MLRRRSLLAAVAGSLPVTGCLGLFGPSSGDLVVLNGAQDPHSVSILLRKEGPEDHAIPADDARPDPEAEPIFRREAQFDVPADDTVRERNFVPEPGVYFVEMEVHEVGTASTWHHARSASDDAIGGGHLDGYIQANGHVALGTGHAD